MTEAEQIWRAKSDDDLLQAASDLEGYTEEGQRVIRAELTRRGFDDPVEQAMFTTPAPGAEPPADVDDAPAEELAPGPACLRCEVKLRFLGTKEFHEGAKWGVMGELGHLFEGRESFDLFVCPQCGHVDMYVAVD